jgi:hypothetical protein
MAEPAQSQAHGAGSMEARNALAAESTAAFELLTRATVRLDPLGGAGELTSLCGRLGTLLARDHASVEVAGGRRSDVIEALFGERVVAPFVASSVTVRICAAARFDYEVRWPDGRAETLPDDTPALASALAKCEAELAQAAQLAGSAVDLLHKRARSATKERVRRATPPADLRALEKRSWLARLLARLVTMLRALFGRTPPPLPAAEPPPALPPIDDYGSREAALAGAKARLATLTSERDRRRRELEAYPADRARRGRERLVELTRSPAPSWIELDIRAPEVPAGVVLVLRPPGTPTERDALDASLFADAPPETAPLAEERPVFRAPHPPTRAALLALLQAIRGERTIALGRRLVAALCLGRNRILELVQRARSAHEGRTRELSARCLVEAEVVRREEQGAQLPIARHAEKIVHDAAARLEELLEEVRSAWQARIESCVGVEQLRAEVAAIEDGAANRLALVCDELRENMTIQFVRLVLELSRPLGQELGRKRLEVARGRSPALEQGFEDVRVVLPSSLDKTFGALKTPEIGELLSGERGILDPIFRTLARQKRECVTRLAARLDDIAKTTTRDLYAAAVFVSPLLSTTLKGLVGELARAHQQWIDTLLAEEQLAWQKLCVRHAPALELVEPLEAAEAKLAALLEGN